LNVSGTTRLNNTTTINSTLDVVNKTTTQDLQVRGILTLPVNNWIIDNNSNVTNNQRIFFDSGAKTYFKSGGTSTSPLLDGFIFRNGQAGTDLLNIDGSGNSTQLGTLLVRGITCMSTLNVSGITILNGNVGIGTNDPKALLHVNGKTLIHNGVGLAPTNGIYGNDATRIILWPGAADNTPYSFGIAGGVLWYTVPTGANHVFYVGTTERMRINNNGVVSINGKQGATNTALTVSDATNATLKIGFPSSGNIGFGGNQGHHLNFGYFSTNADTLYTSQMILNTSTGNVGIGIDNPREKLDIYNGNLVVRATNEAGRAILYLGTPFVSDSALKCALIAEGISNYSRSKLHFCLDDTANNSSIYNASLSNSRMTITNAGNVGIQNTSPWVDLNLGNVDVGGSSGSLVFGKNNGGGGIRNFRQGMSSNFFFVLVIVVMLIIVLLFGLYNLQYHIKPQQVHLLLVQQEPL
jgi:hypothetical protein